MMKVICLLPFLWTISLTLSFAFGDDTTQQRERERAYPTSKLLMIQHNRTSAIVLEHWNQLQIAVHHNAQN